MSDPISGWHPGKVGLLASPPVGVCIYCGISNVLLTKEHIVPLGLGGEHVLPKASCGKCAAITSRFERICLRDSLIAIRTKTNLPTRRPNNRPVKFPIRIVSESNKNTDITIEIDAAEYPMMFSLMNPAPARSLRGLTDSETLFHDAEIWSYLEPESLIKILRKYPIRGSVRIEYQTNNWLPFARMIAKIAYALAVHTFGYGSFRPLILPIIMGEAIDNNFLIGGGVDVGLQSESSYAGMSREHASGMIVSFIRLFPSLNGPTYNVVVGVRDGGTIEPVFQKWIPPQHERVARASNGAVFSTGLVPYKDLWN